VARDSSGKAGNRFELAPGLTIGHISSFEGSGTCSRSAVETSATLVGVVVVVVVGVVGDGAVVGDV